MRTTVFAAVLFFAGCLRPLPPPTPPPGTATCADYCTHALALGCSFAQPTPNGASCETVCLNFNASGVVSWNLDCRAAATSCAAIDQCERTPAPKW